MAVEKAALDLSVLPMAEFRESMTAITERFEKAIKGATKAAIRRKIKRSTETVRFDQEPDQTPKK